MGLSREKLDLKGKTVSIRLEHHPDLSIAESLPTVTGIIHSLILGRGRHPFDYAYVRLGIPLHLEGRHSTWLLLPFDKGKFSVLRERGSVWVRWVSLVLDEKFVGKYPVQREDTRNIQEGEAFIGGWFGEVTLLDIPDVTV